MSAHQVNQPDENIPVLCNRAAENAVLGAILINQEVFPFVKAIVGPEDFYIHRNRWIFEAMDRLWSRHESIDLITVAAELGPERLKEIGGEAYLMDLTNAPESSLNAESYAAIVADLAMRRRLLLAGQNIATAAFRGDLEQSDLVSYSHLELARASAGLKSGQAQTLGDVLAVVKQNAIDRANGAPLPGIPTGLPTLDALLGGGLQPGHLIVLSGNAGAGKTALLLTIGRHAARTCSVRFHSLEMTPDEIGTRLLAQASGINSQAIQTGQLRAAEWPELETAYADLSELPFAIDDTVPLGVAQARASCLQARTDLLIVDYAGLMKSPGPSDYEQQRAVSRGMKNVAGELHIPVLMAVQLNRRNHEMETPKMEHLLGSSSWEHDPNVVIMMYPRKGNGRNGGLLYRLEIAKNRSGPTGCVDLIYRRETTEFEEE